MNKLFFPLLLLLVTSTAVSGQITEIEIGMPEAEMLLYINPREYNDGFNLVQKKSGSYIFLNKTNADFELQVEVQIRGQKISSIKKTYTGNNINGMDVLSNYYQESVRDWSIKSGYSKNDPIRQKAFDTFKSYHPKVEAFTDEEMTALFMFMIYQTSKGLVFTRVERAF